MQWFALLLLVETLTRPGLDNPDLTLASGPKGFSYSLASSCDSNQPLVTLLLQVVNIGPVASPAVNDSHMVWAQDEANPLQSAGSPLKPVPAGGHVYINVGIGKPTSALALAGHHVYRVTVNGSRWITETNYENNTIEVPVDIPGSICPHDLGYGPNGTPKQWPTPAPTQSPKKYEHYAGGALATPTPTPNPYSHYSSGALATPTPRPRFGSAPSNAGVNLARIAAPAQLAYVTDGYKCRQLVGGLYGGAICGEILAGGDKLLLTWNWSPCSDDPNCVTRIDGYRIYPPLGGSSGGSFSKYHSSALQTPIQSSKGQDPKFTFLSSFRPGECFVVVAYLADLESPASPQMCLPRDLALGTKSTSLQPAANHFRSFDAYSVYYTGVSAPGVGNSAHSITNLPNVIRVGYSYNTKKGTQDSAQNSIYRAGIWFDVGALGGITLRKATLHLHARSTTLGNPSFPQTNYTASCAHEIGGGKGDWWDYTGYFDGDWFSTLTRRGPDIYLDVTAQVRDWLGGGQNNGFVLRGPDENASAFTENSCVTNYDVSLDIDYL